jgi:hypothetical protein
MLIPHPSRAAREPPCLPVLGLIPGITRAAASPSTLYPGDPMPILPDATLTLDLLGS